MPTSGDAPSPSTAGDGDGGLLAECLRLLSDLPGAAASSPSFRRHWPSLSAAISSLAAALADPSFPPAAALLLPLSTTLTTLLSLCSTSPNPPLGHLHTLWLLSSSSSSLSQLAADARLLLSSPSSSGDGTDDLLSRLRLGSASSLAAALDSLHASIASLPASSAAAAVSAVSALLDSGDLLPTSRDKAVSVLAAFASSVATRGFLAQESNALVPHLCRALESGGAGAEHACLTLQPLTAVSRGAAGAVAARGGVAALLGTCATGTPAAQAAAAGVLKNLAAFPELLPAFRDEVALPVLLQLVSLGTPRAQELALGCLQNLTGSDGDEGQRLKVEAFQEGALRCVKDFLDTCRGDDPGLAPAFGLLRNLALFRYIAEMAVSAGFVMHLVAALASDRASTRAEAAVALAELCGISNSKVRKEVGEAMPRLIWMLEAKTADERYAAARALAALVAVSGYRKLFKKDERGIVNMVQLLDPNAWGVDKRFPVSVLLSISQSRWCRKQMVAAGACGFLQGLLTAEVDGAKKLAECLSKGKILGVFPRA